MELSLASFVTSVAPKLAVDLIKSGAKRLAKATFGTEEKKALQRAYDHAFGVMLAELAADLDEVNRNHLSALFETFVRHPDAADLLLDLSLVDGEWPIEELRARFDEQGFDRDTLTVDFDAAMASLVKGLSEGLSAEAIKPESPLYNRVSYGRLTTLQLLLERNQRNWSEALRLLRTLEESLKQFGPREINISGDYIGNLMLLVDHTVIQQSILRLPPDLRQFAQAVREAVVEAQRSAGDDRHDSALRDYLRALELYCAKHPYIILDSYLRGRRNSLGEVYVPLIARAGEEEQGGKSVNIAEHLRKMGAAATPSRVLVTGAPGGGKSTLLRQTAGRAWSSLDETGQEARYLPMVVRLQALAFVEDELSLEKKLLKALGKAGDLVLTVEPPEGFIAEWSRRTKTRWLFLLDGLDEVPAEARPGFLRWLNGFVETVNEQGHHVVITSRPARELAEDLGGGFSTYGLLQFTPEQQREFANRWFGEQAENFLGEVRRVETEYLNGTPLLLTIAAVVYDPKESLPERQADLYGRFVDIWLAEAKRSRLKQELGERVTGAAQWALEHLALAMSERPGDRSEDVLTRETVNFLRNAFNMPALEAQIEGAKFINALGRHSGLLSADGMVYEWMHATLREYMAARELARKLEESDHDFAAVLGDKPFKEEWEGVCVYLAGVMQQPGKLIEWLSAQVIESNDGEAAFLVRECWSKSSAADDEQALNALVDALMISLGDDERPHVQREAVETLVWIGPRGVGKLIAKLGELTERINESRSNTSSDNSQTGGELGDEQ